MYGRYLSNEISYVILCLIINLTLDRCFTITLLPVIVSTLPSITLALFSGKNPLLILPPSLISSLRAGEKKVEFIPYPLCRNRVYL